jgi:hypothetical protein
MKKNLVIIVLFLSTIIFIIYSYQLKDETNLLRGSLSICNKIILSQEDSLVTEINKLNERIIKLEIERKVD